MDLSWPDSAIFACPCGTMHPVKYWRWIDAAARPDLFEAVQRDGPFEGPCPECGRLARAAGTWLHVDVPAATATLMLSGERRHAVPGELREHLFAIERRAAEGVQTWMLQPRLKFFELLDASRITRRTAPLARSGELIIDDAPSMPLMGGEPMMTRRDPTSPKGIGVPQLIGADSRGPRPGIKMPSLGAWVGDLEWAGGEVVLRFPIGPDERKSWITAGLRARPILLRQFGYPLFGVRVLGAFMGQVGCVDGLLDPADPATEAVAKSLSRRFEVLVHLGEDDEGEPLTRAVGRSGLESNVQLCFETGRELASQGVPGRESFEKARDRLTQDSVQDRLENANPTVDEGAYQHIVGAVEAAAALAHLDRISRKEHLSVLLEEQGFPVVEYDRLRRRVLAGSLEAGLVAPRRFWRRVISSGLAVDLQDYARRLAENRATYEQESEGEGDLGPDEAREAWQDILNLCQRKALEIPEPLKAALERHREPRESSEDAASTVEEDQGVDEIRRLLRNADDRVRLAGDVLQGRAQGSPDLVFEVLDEFEVDELLALLPDLSDMGSRAVPGLSEKLNSPRREIRQASAILLGLALDPAALEPLLVRLLAEDTQVWLDVAHAIGSYGVSAISPLCELLRRESAIEATDRVARALAEIALGDTESDPAPQTPSPAYEAVASLLESTDARVSTASHRALATLRDVSDFGAIMRGELPPPEHSTVRRFARRAYEAIMIPELEVEVEA